MRCPGHVRGRSRAPEKATMFMTLRTAPIVSVTLPSQKDGTSSHILCARARAAPQRPSALAAAHIRVRGPGCGARVWAPGGCANVQPRQQLASWPNAVASRLQPPRAALLARPTRFMPGLRGACTKTDACAAVWGARQPPVPGCSGGNTLRRGCAPGRGCPAGPPAGAAGRTRGRHSSQPSGAPSGSAATPARGGSPRSLRARRRPARSHTAAASRAPQSPATRQGRTPAAAQPGPPRAPATLPRRPSA